MDDSSYVPEGFALFPSTAHRAASVVPPYRPRRSEGPHSVPVGGDDSIPGSRGSGSGRGSGTKSRLPSNRARPGTAAAVRSSLQPRGDRALRITWEPAGNINLRGRLAVRVRIASGSDQTCEQPFAPEWLDIAGIEYGGEMHKAGSDKKEVLLPDRSGNATIHLTAGLSDASGIELDIVQRTGEGGGASP